MDVVAGIAAIVLGVVFVVAGGVEAGGRHDVDRPGRELGAPQPVATVVPGVELVLGAVLIAGVAEPIPALAAIGLLVVFSVAIARQLVDGRHPPCACFGAWSRSPLGEGHLVRNAA